MSEKYPSLQLVEFTPRYFPEFVEAVPDGFNIVEEDVSIECDPNEKYDEIYGGGKWLLYLREIAHEDDDKGNDIVFDLIVSNESDDGLAKIDDMESLKGMRQTSNRSILTLIKGGKE